MCLPATMLDNADTESRIQIPQFISPLATFQVLNSYICLVAIIKNKRNTEYFHRCRKFY